MGSWRKRRRVGGPRDFHDFARGPSRWSSSSALQPCTRRGSFHAVRALWRKNHPRGVRRCNPRRRVVGCLSRSRLPRARWQLRHFPAPVARWRTPSSGVSRTAGMGIGMRAKFQPSASILRRHISRVSPPVEVWCQSLLPQKMRSCSRSRERIHRCGHSSGQALRKLGGLGSAHALRRRVGSGRMGHRGPLLRGVNGIRTI